MVGTERSIRTPRTKTHVWIRLGDVRINTFMDDVETVIPKLRWKALSLVWVEEPRLMRQPEQPWSGNFGQFAQACCGD